MTEACSQIVTRGAPLFCTRVELSETDEVLVSGPTLAPQFQPQPRSGDLGRWSQAAELEVVGRSSDLIISGGENVAPELVEAVLLEHPGVCDAAVVGRADAEWGDAVTAIIVPTLGVTVSAEELIEFCRPKLAPHERPKRIEFRESLDRSATGKLQRRGL